MTMPQITLIIRRILSVNFALNRESRVEIPKNQRVEAQPTPKMNSVLLAAGRVARKAPSIMEPSIRACGLNQVTTQAVEMTFNMGTSTFVELSIVSWARRRPIPIQITMKLPIKSIAICSHLEACIIAPTPKKQASASVTSKKMTIRAVRYTRLRFCVRAVLITLEQHKPTPASDPVKNMPWKFLLSSLCIF